VGIAAPQVGESLRVIVVASRPGERYPQAPLVEPLVMVNPELLEASAETETGWEGCLSIPGMRGRVARHRAVRVRFSDLAGEVHELALEGFPARVFQHELDHLDGLVFLDRVSDSRQLVTEREYQRLMGA
jgi:peptide deformylase